MSLQVTLDQVFEAENVSDCRLIARLSGEVPIKKPRLFRGRQQRKAPAAEGRGLFDVRIGRIDQ
jgi:hypothetical protein